MFLNNKYTKIYYQIIERAQYRVLNGYTEKHHVMPKSLGGSNDKYNLIKLTAKEHFIVHMLLVRMTTGKDKRRMQFAVFRLMTGQLSYSPCSTIYEQIKRQMSDAKRGVSPSKETRAKMSKAQLGKIVSIETRNKLSIAKKGKTSSMKGKKFSEEHKLKIAIKLSGENNYRFGKLADNRIPVKNQFGDTFESCTEAAIWCNSSQAHIGRCCNGKSKSAGKHPITKEKLFWVKITQLNIAYVKSRTAA